jgi:hypothetical protein
VPFRNAAYEFGDLRPRPRPLPVFCEALFVDVDDCDPRRVAGARPEPFFDVENAQAGFRDNADVEGAQHKSGGDYAESDRAAGGSQRG